jgi:hypothetical protein
MAEYAASIIARLGLDKRGFNDDIRSAASEADAGGARISRGLDVASGGHERLITSSHRAARQIGVFARELSSGASSADIFASAIEGVERVLRLPLGALAGLVGAGFVIKEIAQVREEYQKLKDELEVSLHPALPAEFAALDTLTERIKKLQEQEDKLKAKNEPAGFFSKINAYFRDSFTGPTRPEELPPNLRNVPARIPTNAGVLLDPVDAARVERAEQIRQIRAEKQRDIENEIKKIRDSGLNVEERIAKVRLEAAQAGLATAKTVEDKKSRQLEVDQAQLAVEKAAADAQAAKAAASAQKEDATKSLRESSQVSLADLAREGDQTRSPGGVALGVGAKARDAVREQELARRAALAGNEEEALKHTSRAEQIKSGIGTLRDSEKQLGAALKGALDSSAKLSKIEENTRNQFVNQ